ncbi:MAG TPA: hypothetical protein VNZ43_07210 [Sphingomonadaceae bacterium]|nr:hypothetical protein [Sphingomonadaceae bacterium]
MRKIALAAAPLLLASVSALAAPASTSDVAMPAAQSPSYIKPANATAPVALPCTRACMEDLADRFMKALVAHDPQSLPLAGTVRYTEMGQELALGDGLWGTASAVGTYRHVFADPEVGQIGLFATMKENGNPFVMGARLKVELGRITEMEVVLYRSGTGPAWNDAGVLALDKMGKPRDLWMAEVPARSRLSRQQLVAIANSYFDGIQRNDGKGYYPFTDDCDRLENGVYTTNNPGLVKMGDVDIGGMSCKQQFQTGLYGVVTRVHHRRFLVVDEERGAVFALGVFDHAGTIKELTMPSGKKVSTGFFSRPSSILLAEGFKIKGNLIRQVEAVGASVPYHSDPGW